MQISSYLNILNRIFNRICRPSYLLLSRVKYNQYTYYVYVLPILKLGIRNTYLVNKLYLLSKVRTYKMSILNCT